jgi:hypothetical protein
MSYNNSGHHSELFHYGYPSQTTYHYMSDGSPLNGDDSNFWSSSPRSDSPSPTSNIPNALVGSYSYFAAASRAPPQEQRHSHFRNTYPANASVADNSTQHVQVPFVRVVKRRTTANKKERRRTQSINNAYADLRDCIPNVPPDTKLSKVKKSWALVQNLKWVVPDQDAETGDFVHKLSSESFGVGRSSGRFHSRIRVGQ